MKCCENLHRCSSLLTLENAEILSSGPRAGFYVPVRDYLYKTFDNPTDGGDSTSNSATVKTKIMAAMTTGTMGSIIANPVDVVKIRLMAAPNLYSSMVDGLRSIYRNEGEIVHKLTKKMQLTPVGE